MINKEKKLKNKFWNNIQNKKPPFVKLLSQFGLATSCGGFFYVFIFLELFQLYTAIFIVLKKNNKGFPLQSGLKKRAMKSIHNPLKIIFRHQFTRSQIYHTSIFTALNWPPPKRDNLRLLCKKINVIKAPLIAIATPTKLGVA